MLIPGTDKSIAGIIARPIAKADTNEQAKAIPTGTHFPIMISQIPATIPANILRNMMGIDKALINPIAITPFPFQKLCSTNPFVDFCRFQYF
jgi:hypothetical protein